MRAQKVIPAAILALMLCFGLCCPGAKMLQAETVDNRTLAPDSPRTNLNPYVELLEDPSGELEFSDIISPEYEAQFLPHQDRRAPSYSYTDSAIWVRFQLESPTSEQDWLLELGYPLLNQVDFYYPEEDGSYGHYQTGGAFPFQARDVEHRNFVFNLPASWESDQPFFLRVKTDSALITPLTLWEADNLISRTERSYFGLGLYYGIILIIICYTLVVFAFSREKDYLYYAVFISSGCLFLFTFNGLAFQYLWPNLTWWGQNAINFFLFMGCAAGFLFTREILPIKDYFSPLDKLLKFTGIFAACMIPLTLVFNFTRVMQLGIGTALLGLLLILPAAVICWQKRYRPAVFLFWGWMILALGIMLMSFRSLGIVPDTFLTMYGAQLGFFSMVILILIGLADRMHILKQEKDFLSADLKQRIQEVQSAQSAFLFAQMKPHFLFNALNTISYLTHADPMRAKKLIVDLATYLRQSFDFKEIPSLVPLRDELKLVRAYVNIEKARFSRQLEVEYHIDDQEDVRVPPFSIQPLVENAIIHGVRAKAKGEGKVTISTKSSEAGTTIAVTDNGAGMPAEKLNRIFDGKEESGIALWNIETRLQSIFGQGLKIQSEEGLGTTVQFFVPVQAAGVQ